MCVIAQNDVGVNAEGLIMDNPPICVWLKRDLRIDDHVPLYEAAQAGPLLPLYIIEPDLINAPDFGSLHWTFIRECLIDLNDQLSALGQPLIVRRGDALSVLENSDSKRILNNSIPTKKLVMLLPLHAIVAWQSGQKNRVFFGKKLLKTALSDLFIIVMDGRLNGKKNATTSTI